MAFVVETVGMALHSAEVLPATKFPQTPGVQGEVAHINAAAARVEAVVAVDVEVAPPQVFS